MTEPTLTGTRFEIAIGDLQLPDGPEVVVEDRYFYSDGWRLRGVLVTPAEPPAGPRPAVVWSHGWSGAVNFRVLPLAGRLAQHGYVSLALDHRGFGESEGPRARCDPAEQVRDVANAATYLSTIDGIDAESLAVAGASFGGAIAVAAAAAEPRLKACVSIVGIADGGEWLQSLRPFYEWYALRRRLGEDARDRVAAGRGQRVDLSVLMPGPPSEAMDAEMALIRGKYPDGYPLENAALAMGFRPKDAVGTIAPRALCLIGTRDDTVVPVDHTLALFEQAGEPKSLHLFPEGNHGGPLGPLVDSTADVMHEFLNRHLSRAQA